jgi:hypothetical protein
MSAQQDRAAVVARAIGQIVVGKRQMPDVTEAMYGAQLEIEDYLRNEFADIARQTLAETRLSDP